MNLLLIKTSSLGDVIHMLPAVSDAVSAVPDLRIDWLVERPFAMIPAWHPGVHRVIPIAMRHWKKHLLATSTWQEVASACTTIRAETYDLVLDSQGLVKSALWTRISRGLSAGYDRDSIREPLASWFYDRRLSVPRQQHAIERNRQLMALALNYSLPVTAADYGLQTLLARLPKPELTIPAGSVVGLHGTSRADKLWPTDHWIALAQALAKMGHPLILPWGNDEEHQRAKHIAQSASNVQVLPRLNLNDLAHVLGQAQAVVGVDTGLLHLAAALGKPGLALYTATPPALTGAVSDRHAKQPLRNLTEAQDLQAQAVLCTLANILRTPAP